MGQRVSGPDDGDDPVHEQVLDPVALLIAAGVAAGVPRAEKHDANVDPSGRPQSVAL